MLLGPEELLAREADLRRWTPARGLGVAALCVLVYGYIAWGIADLVGLPVPSVPVQSDAERCLYPVDPLVGRGELSADDCRDILAGDETY